MGKIGDISVTIDGGKEVYRSGEAVKGVWRVQINERVTINDIFISLHGESYVKWTESNPDARATSDLKFISREEYTYQGKYVVRDKTTLDPGVYEYPFNYSFPTDKIPSSFEGKRGCSRYWVNLEITRPMPWRNVVSDKCITFIDNVDINAQFYSKPVSKTKSTRLSKVLGFGDAGEVTLSAKIPRSGFCAGEAIPITVDAVNASKKDLGKLKVSLVQNVEYSANGEKKNEKTFICTITGLDPIRQGQTRSWKDQLLYIDAVPPSTRMRASYCLVVSYLIKVYIDMPLLSGGDVVLWLPITIGTVPQGYKKSAPAMGVTGATPNIPVVDLSNALTHTRCNRGWEKFCRDTGNAIPAYVCYTPMCVYVPNYTYKPKSAVSSPPKQVAPKSAGTGQVKATQVNTARSKSETPSPTRSGSAASPAVNSAKAKPSGSTSALGKPVTQVSKPTSGVQTQSKSTTTAASASNSQNSGQSTSTTSALPASNSQNSNPNSGQSTSTTSALPASNSQNSGQSTSTTSALPASACNSQNSNPNSGQSTSTTSALPASKGPLQGEKTVSTSGLAKTTVAQPSNSLGEGQGHPVPSAPPAASLDVDDEGYYMGDLSASLPSYEDLFGQGAAESKIEVEETATGKVFMLIRFPASQREQFINTMKNYSTGLEKFQGYLSALQHKVPVVTKGDWDKTSLLAVLTFESADMAKDWLKCTPEVCMEKWLGGCQILLVESSEPFQEDHEILSLSNLAKTVEDNGENEDLIRYQYLISEYMRPARLKLGGAAVASSRVNQCLRGKWDMNIDKTVVMLCWPTMEVLKKYKTTVEPEIYQEVVDLRSKVFKIMLSVIIKLGPLPSLTNTPEEEAGEE